MSIYITGAGINVKGAQGEISHEGPLNVFVDAEGVTEPFKLTLTDDEFEYTIEHDGTRFIVDDEPLKNPSPEISTPKSWVIYPKAQAHIMCNVERFHQIVTELTELDVRGFTAWYNETHGAYHIKLNSFTTTIEPIVLAYNLNLIYSGFSEFDALEVKNNG